MLLQILIAIDTLGPLGAGLVLGLTGLGAGIGMGMAVSKATDAISRQPEADGKIRSALMVGLAFIETLAIYSLLIAIMLITM
ncbi:MAG: ATP synthase F0 subunit C [Christensenellaceae bacterium]|jgi:F-type H+-transporting ATPase subunit c|nr:ATP synthase F0 subunit C [Christensenellaceae bacterium]